MDIGIFIALFAIRGGFVIAGERRGQRASGIFMICLGIGLSFLFHKYEEGLRSISPPHSALSP